MRRPVTACVLSVGWVIGFAAAGLAAQQAVPRVRTPDDRFANLKGYAFAPHYAVVNELRMHYMVRASPRPLS